ncbi:MAG: radical SAM protein [Mogibacterium sp.]|nr:radical SAM protein [Mogibacterium sp.]
MRGERKVRIHNMVLHTKVLGPGIRSAVWFQGCKRSCPGCMSPDSRPLTGGREVPVSEISDAILALRDIEGVTISGGEPFLQAEALYELCSRIRAASGLGIILYTGYTVAELRALRDPKVDAILSGLADLVIDGEYVEELNDGRGIRGSANQQLHHITGRYAGDERLEADPVRNVEVHVDREDLFLVGVPRRELLDRWYTAVERVNGAEVENRDDVPPDPPGRIPE